MKFEIDGLEKLIKAFHEAANGGFQSEVQLWLEAMGMEFLDVVQDEIIATGTVDTRRLLNSFEKGEGEGVWELSHGGLSLLVGTNVSYAGYVNDGHWTNPKGVSQRFVPGYWEGGSFVYEPNSDTGMVLKQKWIEGTGYWDRAFAIFSKMFDKSLDRKLQEWLDEFFD